MDPHSGAFGEPGPGKYVRLLQNAIDDLGADDEASRDALYSRARAFWRAGSPPEGICRRHKSTLRKVISIRQYGASKGRSDPA